jgi:hypothetical protein
MARLSTIPGKRLNCSAQAMGTPASSLLMQKSAAPPNGAAASEPDCRTPRSSDRVAVQVATPNARHPSTRRMRIGYRRQYRKLSDLKSDGNSNIAFAFQPDWH